MSKIYSIISCEPRRETVHLNSQLTLAILVEFPQKVDFREIFCPGFELRFLTAVKIALHCFHLTDSSVVLMLQSSVEHVRASDTHACL